MPPPTFVNLTHLAELGTLERVFAEARTRDLSPILPKFLGSGESLAILLPWDPLYAETPGEELPNSGARYPAMDGPSRIVRKDGRWALESG